MNAEIIRQLTQLEIKRSRLHQYVTDKLEERDYHGVADGAMDLRELEVRVLILTEVSKIQQ